MKFPDDAPVTHAKRDALRDRIARLGVMLEAVDEQFIRASGPGGQKVNKTSSGVLLRYARSGRDYLVKWTRERERALNRFLALRELVDRIEADISPLTSERLAEIGRARKRKDRARRRTLAQASK